MDLTRFISVVLGLTAGILSAIVMSQYQTMKPSGYVMLMPKANTLIPKANTLMPKANALMPIANTLNHEHAAPYATGGTNFYFVLPPGTPDRRRPEDVSFGETINTASKQGLFDPRENATLLSDRVKILCVVVLQRGMAANQGKVASRTWTRHCDKVMLLGSEDNAEAGVVNIGMPEGKSAGWDRAKLALQYAFDHLPGDEYQWFVKAHHDSFVVPENLRYLLTMHRANIPGYAGHVFSGPKSSGSVFAVSRPGLDVLVTQMKDYKPSFGGVADDLELEACFKAAGVQSSSRGTDVDGVQRFQMIIPDHKLPLNTDGFATWYWRYIRHPEIEGPECCSDYSISFHYIGPNDMYLLEYMIYHMRPFGIGHYACPANMNTILDHLKATEDQRKEVKGQVEGQENVKQEGDSMLKIMT